MSGPGSRERKVARLQRCTSRAGLTERGSYEPRSHWNRRPWWLTAGRTPTEESELKSNAQRSPLTPHVVKKTIASMPFPFPPRGSSSLKLKDWIRRAGGVRNLLCAMLAIASIACVGDSPALATAATAGGDDSGSGPDAGPGAVGSENGVCYANRTCNAALQCISGYCRKLTADGGPCVLGKSSLGNCTLGH